jgi:hypothetical protein
MTQTDNAHGQLEQLKAQLMPLFLSWYFSQRPREIIRRYKEYAGAFGDAFAFKFMMKTLFSPWKSITDEYPQKGFNLEAIASTFFLNLTSRLIGFVFRSAAILTGVFIQIALFTGYAVYLIIWVFFPLVVIIAIPASFFLPF